LNPGPNSGPEHGILDAMAASGEPPHQLAARPLGEPHPDRLPPTDPAYAAILAAHRAALEAGEDSYLDPSTGLTVFTAGYLARRGTCCDTGCRHCPYLR
jgi:hypothetical protein